MYIPPTLSLLVQYPVSKGDNVIKTIEHRDTCQPEENQNELAISMSELREVASTSVEPLPKIYKEQTQPLKEKGLKVPEFDSVKCGLYNSRKRKLQVSKTVYKSIEEVEVPATFREFLVADYNYENTRLLIFCSEEAKDLLKTTKEYFVDATFKSSPRPFPQMLSILGDLGSTSQTTSVIPLIHVLMSDKKEFTYFALFDILSTKFPEWCPTVFHADFEIAIANALKHFFPDLIIKKCYYHFCQCLWRKAKAIGLKSKLHRRIVGLCTVLPLTPLELVLEGWEYIKAEANELGNVKKIKQFLEYMETQWIDLNISEWNVVGERHRTNNVCESWHSQLNKSINKNYVTIPKLLNVLFIEKNINMDKNRRRVEQTDKDTFIISCQLKLLNNDISLGHFLEMVR